MTVLGFLIIFVMTTLGSAVVFLVKNRISPKTNALILGFAAGIMISAAFWSLLVPSVEAYAGYGKLNWLPASVGVILGGLFLMLLDRVIPHFHIGVNQEEGPSSKLNKTVKFFLAVTIHNIPEGLAVGFAFGAARLAGTDAAYMGALGLAIGIALQNFPEGTAVSLPMYEVNNNKTRSFLLGAGSGIVEPIFAVVGFYLTSSLAALKPWFLSFAAGAMLFVVVEDLIPDAKIEENPHAGTWGVIVGLVVMMILEIALS